MKSPNTNHIMTDMTPPPERESFEREIHDLFRNGDISNIARYLHKDQGLVSKAFNPFCEDKNNPIYITLQYLWAMDCIRPELGDKVLCILTREREKWLGEEPARDTPAKLTAHAGTQFVEAVESELSGATWDEQIAEWTDVEVAAQKKKADLIAKRNYEHFNGNPKRYAQNVVGEYRNGNGRKR